MATINTATFKDLVAQGEIEWRRARDEFPQEMLNSGLFYVENFGPGQGDTKQYSEIDSDMYASDKPEGAQAVEGRVQQGDGVTMSFTRIAKTFTVTWEMRRRNKYRQIQKLWEKVGTTVYARRELDMAHRITFGTATTYTNKDGNTKTISTGDGYALFYTAHEVNGSSTTFRNRLAGNPAVSKGALEGMEKMIVENSINQFGEKDTTLVYDLIWSTDDPNTCNTIREQIQATAEISSPNEGVPNVYRGKYRHVKSARIATDANGNVDTTKAKYWGLCSSKDTPLIIDIEENLTVKTPATMDNAEDILTDDWIYKATGSHGTVATNNGMGITLSTGDGTA